MNYIQQLKDTVLSLSEENKAIYDKIQELKVYLHSSKFQGEGNNWVNIQDVLNRLELI